MEYILPLYNDVVEIPDGWKVITKGNSLKGDRYWMPTSKKWGELNESDHYTNYLCLIRRIQNQVSITEVEP